MTSSQSLVVNDRPLKLLFVNQYYEPDIAATGVLLTQLCEDLATSGAEVRVVTAQPSYTDTGTKAPGSETRNGVEVYRLSLGDSLGRVSMRKRVSGYFKFLYRSRRMARRLIERDPPDIVITASNPPLLERVGRGLAKEANAAYVHIVHDIHPDVLVAGGQMKLPPLSARAWKWLSVRALREADTLVVLSESMKQNLIETKGIDAARIQVVSLWAVPEIGQVEDTTGTRDRFNIPADDLLVVHTGNIGVVQGLDRVIDAAAELRDYPITFLFVGDGAMKDDLEARVRSLELNRVRFVPFQDEQEFRALLSASDIGLVTLKDGMERFSLPSKTFTYLAAGKPILGVMQPGNDVAEIIKTHAAGWTASSANELARVVRELCADRSQVTAAQARARNVYDTEFSRSRAVQAYTDLFTTLAEKRAVAKQG